VILHKSRRREKKINFSKTMKPTRDQSNAQSLTLNRIPPTIELQAILQ